MRAAILMWSGLLLIGSISISKCYPDSNEDADGIALDKFSVRSDSLIESSESSASSRSQKLDEWLNGLEGLENNKKRSRNTCSGCNPKCKPDQLCVAPNLCVCPDGYATSPCSIQSYRACPPSDTANVKPVVSITFGEGAAHYSRATPASLGFSTAYPQVANKRLDDGFFTIVNSVPGDYSTWLAGGLDHTKGCSAGSNKGYMMLVNGKGSLNPIVSVKANDLCIGLRYEFSVYVANVVRKGSNIIKPNIQFDVRAATSDRTLFASLSTDDVLEQPTLTWIQYGMSFIPTSSSVILSISSIVPDGNGNDFAIDDITLTSCSPGYNGVCRAE